MILEASPTSFQGQARLLVAQTTYQEGDVRRHNDGENQAVLEAFKLWCDAFRPATGERSTLEEF